MQRHSLHAIVLSTAFLFTVAGTAQTLRYDWLNQPCMDNLNCSNGCSACNLPGVVPVNFFGTGVQWVGVGVCPHPITTADNAVYTNGWPMEPQAGYYVGVSTATLEDIRIDTLVIRHRRSADGPQRMRVQFSGNVVQVPTVIGDVAVTETFTESVFTDLGCLDMVTGSDYRGFIMRMQAYQGGAGDWQVDAMRIVATPCNAGQVGIAENFMRDIEQQPNSYVDVLGRTISGDPAPGVYIGSRKRVQVF